MLSVGHSLDTQGAALRQSSVYQIESRIGIARDPDSLTAKEGMFYLALSYRFAWGAGLAIEVDVQPNGVSDADGTELRKAALQTFTAQSYLSEVVAIGRGFMSAMDHFSIQRRIRPRSVKRYGSSHRCYGPRTRGKSPMGSRRW